MRTITTAGSDSGRAHYLWLMYIARGDTTHFLWRHVGKPVRQHGLVVTL